MRTFNASKEDFIFWKNLILVGVFLCLTPIVLAISLFSLVLMKNTTVKADDSLGNLSQANIYAPYEQNESSLGGEVGKADARAAIVQQYLDYYNSPLSPYANFIVTKADLYGIDFRLVTAIAQQESNLCKVIPEGSYNCWGWGITSQGTLGFSSFEEGIDTVSKGLKTQYLDKGYLTIEDIMSKYTPSSNGSWANGVNKFIAEMQ